MSRANPKQERKVLAQCPPLEIEPPNRGTQEEILPKACSKIDHLSKGEQVPRGGGEKKKKNGSNCEIGRTGNPQGLREID